MFNKRNVSLFFIVLILNSCSSLSFLQKEKEPQIFEDYVRKLGKNIIKNLDKDSVDKIAVLEFSSIENNSTAFSKVVAEELTTYIFSKKSFKIIERELLNRIVEEQKLSISGQLDENSVKAIGKIFGVDAIVTGIYSLFGNDVRIYARVISTETGEVFSVSKTQIPLNLVESLFFNNHNNNQNHQIESHNSLVYKNNGMTFQLNKCYQENNKILSNLTIINSENDKQVRLFGNVKLTTTTGEVYTCGLRKIADKVTQRVHQVIDIKFVKGVPYKYIITFDNIIKKPLVIALK